MPPQGPHTQFPQLWAGMKVGAPCLKEEVPPDGNLPRRAVEKGHQVQEPCSAQPEWATSRRRTCTGALTPELPGAEQLGEKHTDAV